MNNEAKDESVIPPGGYCYRVRKIEPDEILSTDIERFGKDLREYSYGGGFKEILCPYWERTEYGTVRCNFMDYEVLDEEEPEARKMIIAHFRDNNAPDNFGRSWALPDEIKECTPYTKGDSTNLTSIAIGFPLAVVDRDWCYSCSHR